MPHRIPFFRRADVIPKLNSHSQVSAASCSPPILAQSTLTSTGELRIEKPPGGLKAEIQESSSETGTKQRGFTSGDTGTRAPLCAGKGGWSFFFFLLNCNHETWIGVSISLNLCEALTVTPWKWKARWVWGFFSCGGGFVDGRKSSHGRPAAEQELCGTDCLQLSTYFLAPVTKLLFESWAQQFLHISVNCTDSSSSSLFPTCTLGRVGPFLPLQSLTGSWWEKLVRRCFPTNWLQVFLLERRLLSVEADVFVPAAWLCVPLHSCLVILMVYERLLKLTSE